MHYWRLQEKGGGGGGGVLSASGPEGGYLAEKREGEEPYIV